VTVGAAFDANSLAEVIECQAAQWSGGEILTFVDIALDGSFLDETRTFSQLHQNGHRFAALLANKGLCPGRSFALMMNNHPEFVEAMIGASRGDFTFVPIDPRTRGDKLLYMLKLTECRGIICADYVLPVLRDIRPQLPDDFFILALLTGACSLEVNEGDLAELLLRSRAEHPLAILNHDGPMQMMFTSGTSGDPKAIRSSHRRFATFGRLSSEFTIVPEDKLFNGLSLTHANAQLTTLAFALWNGIPAVFSRRFSKSRLWELLRTYRCTVFNLLGGMATAVYAELPTLSDRDHCVRFALSAGMPPAYWHDFEQRFGILIFEWYGQSEGVLTLNPPRVGPVGSVGKPPPHLRMAILDENGLEVAAGVEGEIAFKAIDGSLLTLEYYKNPDASAAKFRRGWLLTGDVGLIDDQGWLYFHARAGGIIRRNGDFVSPGFVEGAIAQHSAVSDVFVYGIPAISGAPGESDIVAAIVLHHDAAIGEDDLRAHCRVHLESNLIPSHFQIVDAIPKTISEKPLERVLRVMLAEQTAPADANMSLIVKKEPI
jgi:carnitine-CoA ligase